jgi:catechol 2,3-dioxygenase-like lactoylglutathione lyase family enzyme
MEVAQLKNHVRRVQTVAVPVGDQEKALAFYVGTLGLELRMDAPFGPGMRWIEVAPSGAQTSIALPPLGTLTPGVDTGIRLMVDDADTTNADLKKAGVDVDEVLRFGDGVPPMFVVRDPDGNTLYMVEQS